MKNKFSANRLTHYHRELIQKISTYFSEQTGKSPWRNDYVVLRMSQYATNEYNDIIFIPNFNDEDDFDFYSAYKCNAFASDSVKIITGSYQYRLAKRFGCIYGQQMEPIYYYDVISMTMKDDYEDKHLIGVNLIAHPLHVMIPLYTPISNVSKGSIILHPSAHTAMKNNFNSNPPVFKLFVIDITLLL
jgi:hypothetical protein